MTPMKSIHRILALATFAATAFLPQVLHAQVNRYASRVNVPFAFNYGSQHFTPGIYTVRILDSNYMALSSDAETSMAVIQSGTEGRGPSRGYLIFRKYGNRYFLAEYHPANSEFSAELLPSKTERSVAHDFATNKVDTGRVRLALLENGSDLIPGR